MKEQRYWLGFDKCSVDSHAVILIVDNSLYHIFCQQEKVSSLNNNF